MNDHMLISLHEIRGSLRGKQDVAKCGILSAHDCLQADQSRWAQGYYQGQMKAYVQTVRHLQHCINRVTKLIKELNNAREKAA